MERLVPSTPSYPDFSTIVSNATEMDVEALAKSHILYKIGDNLNRFYFPVLVPVGITGNILSFLIMVQPHNRNMAFSLYISVLSVVDTVALIIGFTSYLNQLDYVDISSPFYCKIANSVLFSATLCSALIIISMTFDRFYSIIRPHKAASFNTVKRAKITIAIILIFGIAFNCPQLVVTLQVGKRCIPYGNSLNFPAGQFYYWLATSVNFFIPFILLLGMNCVIINTLRNRSNSTGLTRSGTQGQGQGEGQGSKMKSSERQITITLLLVTFSFLILDTPPYAQFFYAFIVDVRQSVAVFAGYHLFYMASRQCHYTNYGINFFLYVASGQKFRSDLMGLFQCKKDKLAKKGTKSILNEFTQGTEISIVSATDAPTKQRVE